MKQDLVAALGVTISSAEYIAASLRCGAPIYNEYVSVASLRAALEKLPVVYGISYSDGQVTWKTTPHESDTHTARLFAVEEIKKEPVKVEFKLDCTIFDPEVAFDNSRWGAPRSKVNQLKNKKWKITAEEIVEE